MPLTRLSDLRRGIGQGSMTAGAILFGVANRIYWTVIPGWLSLRFCLYTLSG